MVVAVCTAVDPNVGAATATTKSTKSLMKFSKIQHGRIKDRSYFTESSLTYRFKDFTEKNDCLNLVDFLGSDVTTNLEPITSKSAVIHSILMS